MRPLLAPLLRSNRRRWLLFGDISAPLVALRRPLRAYQLRGASVRAPPLSVASSPYGQLGEFVRCANLPAARKSSRAIRFRCHSNIRLLGPGSGARRGARGSRGRILLIPGLPDNRRRARGRILQCDRYPASRVLANLFPPLRLYLSAVRCAVKAAPTTAPLFPARRPYCMAEERASLACAGALRTLTPET